MSVNVNLATHPLRNRKAFSGLTAFLAAGCLAVLALSAATFFRYHGKHSDTEAALAKLRASIRQAEMEGREFTRRVEAVPSNDKDQVKLVNSVIYIKSLSWTDFFTRMEESLPALSYLNSMDPRLKDESTLEVRLKVVCPNLDDRITFITNLNARNFGSIRVLSDSRNDRGLLVSEITLTYEWHD